MKKFIEVYKQKINEAEKLHENKILNDFNLIYKTMLDNYGITSVKNLDEASQDSFLTELSEYWSEESGLNEKGLDFIKNRSMNLNENSTVKQKKNYLSKKTYSILKESIEKNNLKYKIYDILDEMYKQVKARDISEVLSPTEIVGIVRTVFDKSFDEFFESMYNELKESTNYNKKYIIKAKLINEREFSGSRREKLAKEGKALPDGSFPIVTVEDLKNAIKAHGRAKDPELAKRHIKKRARQMGKYDLIPDSWK